MGNRRITIEEILIERALRDSSFREQLVANPKAAISAELEGVVIPDDIEITVVQEKMNELVLVLPESVEQIEGIASIRESISWGDAPKGYSKST